MPCSLQLPHSSTCSVKVIVNLGMQNDLEFLRIRSRKHEVMVAPSACGACG